MEKAMYLKGLCDGLEPDKTTKEGKLIDALLDMVTEMAAEMDDMQAEICEVKDYCEELDEDLGDVEELLYDDDEDCCDGDCDCCDGCDDCDDFDMEETYEVECPKCHETICFDETLDPENLICPACGDVINFDATLDPESMERLDYLIYCLKREGIYVYLDMLTSRKFRS